MNTSSDEPLLPDESSAASDAPTPADTPPPAAEPPAVEAIPGPIWLRLIAVPEELKARPQWVLWRSERRDGKPTKVPYNPNTLDRADITDPTTWSEFAIACLAFGSRSFTGLGYVFTADDPYAGFDQDDCRDPQTGEIASWAEENVRFLNSYTEVSPSGTGLKTWVRAGKRGPRCTTSRGNKCEFYDRNRFFAVTGQVWAGVSPKIEARDAEFNALYAQTFGERSAAPAGAPSSETASLTDTALLTLAFAAKNGDETRARRQRNRGRRNASIRMREVQNRGQNGHNSTKGELCPFCP